MYSVHQYTVLVARLQHADTDSEVTLNFINISIQQPTEDCTVTNSQSFRIGQCVNVGMHWLCYCVFEFENM